MSEAGAAQLAELAAENAELKRSLAATTSFFAHDKELERETVTVQDPALLAELSQVYGGCFWPRIGNQWLSGGCYWPIFGNQRQHSDPIPAQLKRDKESPQA